MDEELKESVQDLRIVLHLGAHKTGTTYLQNFLNCRIKRLHKDNVHVMRWGKVRRSVRGAEKKGGYRSIQEFLTAPGENGPVTKIISYETFLGAPFSNPDKGLYGKRAMMLRELVKACEGLPPPVIVYYIRNQADFLESYYLQQVQQGGVESFDRWVARLNFTNLSWKPVINSIKLHFPNSEIVVRNYSIESKEGNAAFVRNFFACFRPDYGTDDFYRFETESNVSLSGLGLSMLVVCNRLFRDRSTIRQRVRRFLQKHFNNRRFPRPALLSAEARAALDTLYSEENKRLAAAAVS